MQIIPRTRYLEFSLFLIKIISSVTLTKVGVIPRLFLPSSTYRTPCTHDMFWVKKHRIFHSLHESTITSCLTSKLGRYGGRLITLSKIMWGGLVMRTPEEGHDTSHTLVSIACSRIQDCARNCYLNLAACARHSTTVVLVVSLLSFMLFDCDVLERQSHLHPRRGKFGTCSRQWRCNIVNAWYFWMLHGKGCAHFPTNARAQHAPRGAEHGKQWTWPTWGTASGAFVTQERERQQQRPSKSPHSRDTISSLGKAYPWITSKSTTAWLRRVQRLYRSLKDKFQARSELHSMLANLWMTQSGKAIACCYNLFVKSYFNAGLAIYIQALHVLVQWNRILCEPCKPFGPESAPLILLLATPNGVDGGADFYSRLCSTAVQWQLRANIRFLILCRREL